MILEDREETPKANYIPYAIVKWEDGYAIQHGQFGTAMATKPTIEECLLLAMEWKRRGKCESWHIDNLFILGRIEFPKGSEVKDFKTFLVEILAH